MFKISKACEYAILFLANLAKSDYKKPVKLKQITKKIGLPYKYLSKIVLDLKKAKIIGSKEGIGGGYFLAKPLENISIGNIIQAVEGKKGLVSCIHGKCELEESCMHRNIWINLQEKLEQELESIKLRELVSFRN